MALANVPWGADSPPWLGQDQLLLFELILQRIRKGGVAGGRRLFGADRGRSLRGAAFHRLIARTAGI